MKIVYLISSIITFIVAVYGLIEGQITLFIFGMIYMLLNIGLYWKKRRVKRNA